jgi:hypothetical protein
LWSRRMPVAETGSGSTPPATANPHRRLADSLARYHVNDYAASDRGFAVKPGTTWLGCAHSGLVSIAATSGIRWVFRSRYR